MNFLEPKLGCCNLSLVWSLSRQVGAAAVAPHPRTEVTAGYRIMQRNFGDHRNMDDQPGMQSMTVICQYIEWHFIHLTHRCFGINNISVYYSHNISNLDWRRRVLNSVNLSNRPDRHLRSGGRSKTSRRGQLQTRRCICGGTCSPDSGATRSQISNILVSTTLN